MKIFRNVAIFLFGMLLALFLFLGIAYKYNMAPVDKDDDKEIEVVIEPSSSSRDIAKTLKEQGLIKSEKFFLIYLRLFNVDPLKATTYQMKKSMTFEEIIDMLTEGNNYNPDEVRITFKEGINARKVATLISQNTNNKYEDVLKKMNDEVYLNTLIKKYWFITEEVKNKDIYYKLEGYLFPDTYHFDNKDVTVEDIFAKMLRQTDRILTPYRKAIESSGYTTHQILTLASIIELEGVTSEDRKGISGVFYNRLNRKMSLGSDVTTYYGAKVDQSERDLTKAELDMKNAYNTRASGMEGRLPVGPVSAPSKMSIEAAIAPAKSTYLYFVADKNRKVYFSNTYSEHQQKIAEIKAKGDWITW